MVRETRAPNGEESKRNTETSRRSFMQAAGAGMALPFMGTTEAKDSEQMNLDTADMESYETFEFSSDRLVLGGTRVVGTEGYPTIAAAWNDAESGDEIYVHSSYDAAAAGEEFPVVLDYEEKEVMLTGGHPSGSVIDASHTSENVIEVLGRGMNDYRNNPLVQNLKIVGGGIGLRVRAAPFSSYENLVLYQNGSHGVAIEGYTDPDSGRDKGTYGATFSNCQAFSCGGDAFRTERDAKAHGTTFFGCRATNNEGVGFNIRGYTNKIVGGTTQLNGSYGVEARLGKASLVKGVYIEGNSRNHDFPVEVYGKNADGLAVENCYFNGINPRGASHDYEYVRRGVNVHGTQKLSVRDCVVRNYRDGFISLFGCEDADVYAGSHHVFDAGNGLFATDVTGHGNARTRSNGLILPTDLSNVEPLHEYDMGYHVGGAVEGLACWRDGDWQVMETTTL